MRLSSIWPNQGIPQPQIGPSAKGLLVYADGTTWNPGSGAGWYHYDGTSFTKVALDLSIQSAPSRALGTVYQNTYGRPKLVSVAVYSTSVTVLTAISDSSASPTTEVAKMTSGGANYRAFVFFVVLPNHYYKVTSSAGTPTLELWIEWN